MELTAPLSWHEPQWDLVQRRRAGQRLPHALMLTGPAGVGKGRFAERMARALLCARPGDDGDACGACPSCQLYRAGTHPDIRRVAPEEEGKAIRIDAVRELTGYLTLKSQYGGYRIAIITPADRMNSAAANALLKTLEEPAPLTLLVLVCARPGALPATVRSRCQVVPFGIPDREPALQWLQRCQAPSPESALDAAGGAPLKALELAVSGDLELRDRLLGDLERLAGGSDDPIAVAARYQSLEKRTVLSWMLSYVADVIRLAMASSPSEPRNPGTPGGLAKLASHRNLIPLFQYRDDLLNALWLSETQVNAQLLMEDLMVRWRRLGDR